MTRKKTEQDKKKDRDGVQIISLVCSLSGLLILMAVSTSMLELKFLGIGIALLGLGILGFVAFINICLLEGLKKARKV